LIFELELNIEWAKSITKIEELKNTSEMALTIPIKEIEPTQCFQRHGIQCDSEYCTVMFIGHIPLIGTFGH
jgi:hypothetical protein